MQEAACYIEKMTMMVDISPPCADLFWDLGTNSEVEEPVLLPRRNTSAAAGVRRMAVIAIGYSKSSSCVGDVADDMTAPEVVGRRRTAT